jgi:ubiquinone/menaquinone biosynthesis C-methylase UbiE
VITSRGSYPFWPDLQKGIAEIRRVLKPGGAAYIGRGFSKNLPLAIARSIREKQGKKMNYDARAQAQTFEKIMRALGIERHKIVMPSVDAGLDVNYGVWLVFWKGAK